MRICVYAIAKNEEKFVERWMKSMSEADYICVLDTGSTDKTVEKLSDIRGDVKEIGWGSQIRSYVLQPYTMVKDHRTGCESGNAQAVLDGGLDPFISAYLKWQSLGGKPQDDGSEM